MLAGALDARFATPGEPIGWIMLIGEDIGTSDDIFLGLAIVVEDNVWFGLNAAKALKRLRTVTLDITSMFVSKSVRGVMRKDIGIEGVEAVHCSETRMRSWVRQ